MVPATIMYVDQLYHADIYGSYTSAPWLLVPSNQLSYQTYNNYFCLPAICPGGPTTPSQYPVANINTPAYKQPTIQDIVSPVFNQTAPSIVLFQEQNVYESGLLQSTECHQEDVSLKTKPYSETTRCSQED
jgi:hypothetical protein